MTGNLAVTNFSSLSSGPGGVAMYAHGRGRRTLIFAKSGLFRYYYDDYDDKGNLYVDGMDRGDHFFEFAKLPAGRSKFVNITLNTTLGIPGGVKWDGQNIAIGVQSLYGPSALYRFSIHGRFGVTEGFMPLTGSCDVLQFALVNRTLVAPNNCSKSVKFWSYPAGGAPLRSIPVKGPAAVVISPAKV